MRLGEKNTALIAGFKEIFPTEKPLTVTEYFSGINRENMLNAFSHFAGFKVQNSKFEHYNALTDMWFGGVNENFKNYVKRNCYEFEKRQGSFTIINPISSLSLFEDAYSLPEQPETVSNQEAEILLFKAYLRASQDWIERESAGIESRKTAPKDLEIHAQYLLGSFYKHEFLNTNVGNSFLCQCLKANMLFKFLAQHSENTKFLLHHFLNFYECASVDDYWKKILPLYSSVFLKDKKEGDTKITIIRNENFEESSRFLDKLSLEQTAEVKDDDFSIIRAFPFYKIKEGEYRIIYDLFVVDKLFRGLYFKFWELYRNKAYPADKKMGDWRGFYCDNFSEKFLLANTLHSIADGDYFECSEDDAKKMGMDKSAPDYYLRRGDSVLLFESKDALIKKAIKQSFDYNVITNEIRESFVNKAIEQLVGNIRKLLTNDWLIDTDIEIPKSKIYPILVTHHENFNAGGLNYIVNYWFQDELHKLSRDENIDISPVQKLVIVDIDTLLINQDVFRDNTISLEDALEGYIKFIYLVPTQIFLPTETHMQMKIESTYPFSMYMRMQTDKIPGGLKIPLAVEQYINQLPFDPE